MIYLDNASTTQPSKQAIEIANHYCDKFFNPSSIYLPAINTAKDIQSVRTLILTKLGNTSGGLVFTSGATESNNLALFQATKYKNKIIITSLGEHPSVFNYAKHLESQGYRVLFVGLNPDGTVNIEELKELIDNNNVGFVSIMFVNNETGAINPIKEIGQYIKSKDKEIIFHVDAVQAFNKLDFNVKDYQIDLLTISAHKIHGIKGTGALCYNSNMSIKPLLLGGGQEFSKRSGTENVPGIMALGQACKETNTIDSSLRKTAIQKLKKLDNIKINGDGIDSILSVSAKGIKAEVVVRRLDEKGIYISSGSACNSHKADNRVLSAMGLSKEYIEGTNRFSFSKYTTIAEVETAINEYIKVITELRSL